MSNQQHHLPTLISQLATTPARIAHRTAGWSREQLQSPPSEGAWSARDILAHLRAADDIITPRIYMVLARNNPTLSAYDERRWSEIAGYADQDFATSLSLFTLRRAEVVMMLQNLDDEAWERTGIHEVQGAVSLREIVEGLVEHEEGHCTQLEAIPQFLS